MLHELAAACRSCLTMNGKVCYQDRKRIADVFLTSLPINNKPSDEELLFYNSDIEAWLAAMLHAEWYACLIAEYIKSYTTQELRARNINPLLVMEIKKVRKQMKFVGFSEF
jgi:hypothetical protein